MAAKELFEENNRRVVCKRNTILNGKGMGLSINLLKNLINPTVDLYKHPKQITIFFKDYARKIVLLIKNQTYVHCTKACFEISSSFVVEYFVPTLFQ